MAAKPNSHIRMFGDSSYFYFGIEIVMANIFLTFDDCIHALVLLQLSPTRETGFDLTLIVLAPAINHQT